MLHIDIETRSPINLITAGAHRYADNVELICACYAFDDGPVQVWLPKDPVPDDLQEYLDGDGEICAFNAEFEATVLANYFTIEPHRWTCAAAMARACSLPSSLMMVTRALGCTQKSTAGHNLIMAMCIPPYNEDPAMLKQMIDYCKQDVEAEREVYHLVREFEPNEHDDHLVNLLINKRGIPVDQELATHALRYADDEKDALGERIKNLTGLTASSGVKVTLWIYERLGCPKLMEREGKLTLDKRTRFELLALPEIPHDAREVLECLDLASRSSVAKYRSMLTQVQKDGRVRGAYLLNGAGQTGRYSSKGLQVHNFPRTCDPDPEAKIEIMSKHRPLPDCLETLSHLLRAAILAPEGKWFVGADWSAIEGRVCPWLAEEEVKLELFRSGEDIYIHTARGIYTSQAIDDQQRQVGKVAELSLQFGGGIGALKNMGRNYGVNFSDDEADDIKVKWRKVNPWAPAFWRAAEQAALAAYDAPDEPQRAGRLTYIYTPGALGDALWCFLPSGRPICYPQLKREYRDGPYGTSTTLTAMKSSLSPKQGENEWPRMDLWGGILVQGATQATAADLLRGSLRTLVLDMDAPVFLHTHDEIALEVDEADVDAWTEKLLRVMTTNPEWAEGLPLAAEPFEGHRYGK